MANRLELVRCQRIQLMCGRIIVLLLMLLPVFGWQSADAGQLPVATIVAKMASASVFQLQPKATARYFRELCRLRSNGAGKYLWVYENSRPGRGMLWLRVEFQPGSGAAGHWVYLQSQLALPPDAYGALKKSLGERLGKPQFESEKTRDKIVAWSLGGDRQVVLRRGRFDNPYRKTTQSLVLLESVIAQGEGED